MASIGPGSGQQHLLALLRAIRLRTESSAADAGGPDAGGPAAETTPGAGSSSGTAARPPIVVSVRPVQVPPATPPALPGTPASGTALQTPAGSAVQVSPGSAVVARSGSTVVVPGVADVDVPVVTDAPIPAAPTPGAMTPVPSTPGANAPAPAASRLPAIPGSAVPAGPVPGGAVPAPHLPGHPNTQAPATHVPGTQFPGTQFPGTQIPGTQIPGPQVPGSQVAGGYPTRRGRPAGPVPTPPAAAQPPPVHPSYPQRAPHPPGTGMATVPGNVPVPVHPGLVVPGATGPVGPVVPPLGRPQPGGHDIQPWPYPTTGGAHGTHHAGAHHPVPADPLLHVPPVVRSPAGATVDGPDPADDVALHHLHEVLLTSLSMAGGVDAVAGRLRAALLLAHPRLMASVPGTEATHREQLAQALTWLVDNLEHPPVLAAGCGQLGAALREFGVQAQQLQLTGAALAEAMRAGMPNAWKQEYDAAWRSTWHHVHEWMIHGAEAARYTPMRWTAVVLEHDQRRADLAVLRLRPYLPMPFQPGQYARVAVAEQPGVWRPYSLAGAPRVDNVLELHVRAKGQSGVSGALVHRIVAGDTVRLSRAEGNLVLPPEPKRNLLFIAGDTGVAPLKALLTEIARTADPREVLLFWGVRTLGDLYDIGEVEAVARACRRATVVPVISEGRAGPYASGLVTDAVAAYGEWSQHEVFIAGPPPMLIATRAVLRALGLADERIHHDPTDVDRPPT